MSANNPTATTATVKSRPGIAPSSYLYTSSSGLLSRNNADNNGVNVNKPTPPPTLPKYTSSFNAGSLNRERDKDGIGGSYRLSSLDRLAMRQKFLDQQNPGLTAPNGGSPQTNGDNPPTPTASVQSKREMFFNSTGSPTGEGAATAPLQPAAKPAKTASNETRCLTNDANDATPKPGAVATAPKECPPPKPKVKELDGYVGFANLPNQVYRKAVKKGFEFTLMVVGESGLGKSTLINSMFLTDIYSPDYPGPSQRLKKTVEVETTKVLMKENGVNLTLTVVDTPGFGDAVDNSNCWAPIIDYIEDKYEDYLNSESRVTRKSNQDQRVHCCLYFIRPSGHGLKPLDIEFMKRLCDKVNIIPVIAKADTLTSEECALSKRQILNEITQNKIKIYEFPDTQLEEEDENKLNAMLKNRVPFAVVGANAVVEVDGKKVRGRKYPWGVAEVENLEHCDFIALRNTIIRTHLQDLKDVTNNVHYENYRCCKLAGLGADGKPTRLSNKNPLTQMDEEKREHELKMKKMEAEMEQVFEMKVREKKQKLKDSEGELQRRHEATKKTLEAQAKELEEKRRMFEEEKELWERENQITVEDLRRRSLEGGRESAGGGDGKKEKKKKGLF
ncbi:unnamed protein product [Phyllotreta striolata]|uniref:Septin-type G domain-containing protein n=1 Tax=Phyllotreta striolata TaxID=444603 RepID=A0A9N9TLB6_PHYSR|nr:unnamed protein product [Phyllotreta striolata]